MVYAPHKSVTLNRILFLSDLSIILSITYGMLRKALTKKQKEARAALCKHHPDFPSDDDIKTWTIEELVEYFVKRNYSAHYYRSNEKDGTVFESSILLQRVIAFHDIERRLTPHPIYNPQPYRC